MNLATFNKFIKEYKSKGQKIAAYAAAGVSCADIKNAIDENADWKKLYNEAEDHVLDMVEDALRKACFSYNQTALKYYLDNKGKSRGFGSSYDPTREQEHKVTISVEGQSDELNNLFEG